MGIDLLGARSGALRQLVLDCPPPVNAASGRVMQKLGMRPWRRTIDPSAAAVAVHELTR
jgi:RimJ/RimL family protein N-acetyltransferase